MFYKLEVKSHIRVPPTAFGKPTKDAVLDQLNERFEGHISPEVGFIIVVTEVLNIGEGIVVPGDGAIYYETKFRLLTFIPELQELVQGPITDITNFGAFLNLGPVDGMIHVSQTMDDFISFSKQKTLQGKETKQVLKVGDKCRARIVALSFKDATNPKIGLTMRQPGLGALQWAQEKQKKK